MAAFAIGVKGITPFGVAVRAMAILTSTRAGPIFLFFVVAIIARKRIPCVCRVCLVVKQDASCAGLKHEPHRLFRSLCREGSVTDDAYNEQDCRKDKCQRLFIL
jgi:hypothetical protein